MNSLASRAIWSGDKTLAHNQLKGAQKKALCSDKGMKAVKYLNNASSMNTRKDEMT
jgi:hypothetical protein